MIRAFELLSHTKAVANKKAMSCDVVAFRARKKSPKTRGVKIKIAPSFASTAVQKNVSVQSAMNRVLAGIVRVFWWAESCEFWAEIWAKFA